MKRILWPVCLAYLIHALPSMAAVPGNLVAYGGNEWAQPVNFTFLSWSDIKAVCPAPTGLCQGTLNGLDVTGFVWASVSDIEAFLIGRFGVPPFYAATEDSVWAPLFFSSFTPLDDDDRFDHVEAWSRDESVGVPGKAERVRVVNSYNPTFTDFANAYPIPMENGFSDMGAWFYRPTSTAPTAVPAMSTYGLMFTVISLLIVAVRRLSSKSVKAG